MAQLGRDHIKEHNRKMRIERIDKKIVTDANRYLCIHCTKATIFYCVECLEGMCGFDGCRDSRNHQQECGLL